MHQPPCQDCGKDISYDRYKGGIRKRCTPCKIAADRLRHRIYSSRYSIAVNGNHTRIQAVRMALFNKEVISDHKEFDFASRGCLKAAIAQLRKEGIMIKSIRINPKEDVVYSL